MTNKEYLALAIPFVISTVTQPLLGAVDTAVIGRLEDPAYIGGIAIGAVIFNTLYWLFGFLRVSTSGFSAQSLGSKGEESTYLSYIRPIFISIIISIFLLLFQVPIKKFALIIYQADSDVIKHALTYYNILIWGAPCVLMGYVNLGWLMGRKHIKASMTLQISSNLLNIILDLYFVMGLKMGVFGVAMATLIAQGYAFLLGSFFIAKKIDVKKIFLYGEKAFDWASLKKIIMVNSDLMIRTICLLIMTNMFIAKGASLGTLVLASNALIYQIQYIISYIYDGFANALSVFAGKYYGAKEAKGLAAVFKISTVNAIVLGGLMSVLLLLFKEQFIGVFTSLDDVIAMSKAYYFWLIIFSNVISIGMLYYGIFSGCTFTAPIRNSMIFALLVFIFTYLIAIPFYGNHGLWFAFVMFSLSRSVVLYVYKNRLFRHTFGMTRQGDEISI